MVFKNIFDKDTFTFICITEVYIIWFNTYQHFSLGEQKLRNILESSELSQLFKIIKQEGKEEEAVMRYLHDFVHIVYEPTSESPEEEIQVCIIWKQIT